MEVVDVETMGTYVIKFCAEKYVCQYFCHYLVGKREKDVGKFAKVN